jgi:hypothetical protein
LLIKPRDSSGELIIDTETELSNRYFAASLMEIAGIDHRELGLSFFDIINGTPAPVRTLYAFESWWATWTRQGLSGSINLSGIYEINGDANDAENWTFIPSYHIP